LLTLKLSNAALSTLKPGTKQVMPYGVEYVGGNDAAVIKVAKVGCSWVRLARLVSLLMPPAFNISTGLDAYESEHMLLGRRTSATPSSSASSILVKPLLIRTGCLNSTCHWLQCAHGQSEHCDTAGHVHLAGLDQTHPDLGVAPNIITGSDSCSEETCNNWRVDASRPRVSASLCLW
jgi:hypothetical protein